MRLKDKVAIITGGARGMGLAAGRRFVSEGASVVLVDIDEDAGTRAAEELAKEGGRARFLRVDISSRAEIRSAWNKIVSDLGRIDVLYANAATTDSADFLDVTEENFDRVMRINLKGVFLCGQEAARHMVRQASGCIINVASVGALLAIPSQVAYVVSKAGVVQLTKVMAVALANSNIRVNAIGPGTINTPLSREAVWADPAARHAILSRTPLGRLGEPEEIAAIAAFLASDDASYMTGQTIYADGGRLALNYVVPVRDDTAT